MTPLKFLGFRSAVRSALSASSSRRGEAQRGAIGWSLIYMVFGGGLLGALLIFVVLKFFGG